MMAFFEAGWLMGLAVFFSFWGMGIVALFVLWLVHEESEAWAIAWLFVLAFITYNVFTIDLMTLLISMAAWIPIGICWSFYRWKRFCADLVEEHNEQKTLVYAQNNFTDPGERERMEREMARDFDRLKDRVDPGENITRLVQWILIWPFSVIENVLGDIYDMVVQLVKTYLINFYSKISNNALNQVK